MVKQRKLHRMTVGLLCFKNLCLANEHFLTFFLLLLLLLLLVVKMLYILTNDMFLPCYFLPDITLIYDPLDPMPPPLPNLHFHSVQLF